MKEIKKSLSVRIEPTLLAKAHEALLGQNISPDSCKTISQIVRLTFLFGLSKICSDPTSSPRPTSMSHINQIINQKSSGPTVGLSDILKQAK